MGARGGMREGKMVARCLFVLLLAAALAPSAQQEGNGTAAPTPKEPCPPGAYQLFLEDGFVCLPCPPDMYRSEGMVPTMCIRCPPLSSTQGRILGAANSTGATSISECTCNAGYVTAPDHVAIGSDLSCVRCPGDGVGWDCPGGGVVNVHFGWYKPAGMWEAIECTQSHESCPAATGLSLWEETACTKGSFGPMCESCEADYYSLGGSKCLACPGSGKAIGYTAVGAIAITMFLTFIFVATKVMHEVQIVHLKLLIGFMQITFQFSDFAVDWPGRAGGVMQKLGFAMLNVFDVLPPNCLTKSRFTYYKQFYAATVLPIAMLGAIGIVYLMATVYMRMAHHSDPMLRAVSLKKFGIQCWRNAIWVQMLLYPGVSTKLVKFFGCEDIAGGRYLKADMSISCDDDQYRLHQPFAIVAFIIYPIGFPSVLAGLMTWHIRHQIKKNTAPKVHAIAKMRAMQTARKARNRALDRLSSTKSEIRRSMTEGVSSKFSSVGSAIFGKVSMGTRLKMGAMVEKSKMLNGWTSKRYQVKPEERISEGAERSSLDSWEENLPPPMRGTASLDMPSSAQGLQQSVEKRRALVGASDACFDQVLASSSMDTAAELRKRVSEDIPAVGRPPPLEGAISPNGQNGAGSPPFSPGEEEGVKVHPLGGEAEFAKSAQLDRGIDDDTGMRRRSGDSFLEALKARRLSEEDENMNGAHHDPEPPHPMYEYVEPGVVENLASRWRDRARKANAPGEGRDGQVAAGGDEPEWGSGDEASSSGGEEEEEGYIIGRDDFGDGSSVATPYAPELESGTTDYSERRSSTRAGSVGRADSYGAADYEVDFVEEGIVQEVPEGEEKGSFFEVQKRHARRRWSNAMDKYRDRRGRSSGGSDASGGPSTPARGSEGVDSPAKEKAGAGGEARAEAEGKEGAMAEDEEARAKEEEKEREEGAMAAELTRERTHERQESSQVRGADPPPAPRVRIPESRPDSAPPGPSPLSLPGNQSGGGLRATEGGERRGGSPPVRKLSRRPSTPRRPRPGDKVPDGGKAALVLQPLAPPASRNSEGWVELEPQPKKEEALPLPLQEVKEPMSLPLQEVKEPMSLPLKEVKEPMSLPLKEVKEPMSLPLKEVKEPLSLPAKEEKVQPVSDALPPAAEPKRKGSSGGGRRSSGAGGLEELLAGLADGEWANNSDYDSDEGDPGLDIPDSPVLRGLAGRVRPGAPGGGRGEGGGGGGAEGVAEAFDPSMPSTSAAAEVAGAGRGAGAGPVAEAFDPSMPSTSAAAVGGGWGGRRGGAAGPGPVSESYGAGGSYDGPPAAATRRARLWLGGARARPAARQSPGPVCEAAEMPGSDASAPGPSESESLTRRSVSFSSDTSFQPSGSRSRRSSDEGGGKGLPVPPAVVEDGELRDELSHLRPIRVSDEEPARLNLHRQDSGNPLHPEEEGEAAGRRSMTPEEIEEMARDMAKHMTAEEADALAHRLSEAQNLSEDEVTDEVRLERRVQTRALQRRQSMERQSRVPGANRRTSRDKHAKAGTDAHRWGDSISDLHKYMRDSGIATGGGPGGDGHGHDRRSSNDSSVAVKIGSYSNRQPGGRSASLRRKAKAGYRRRTVSQIFRLPPKREMPSFQTFVTVNGARARLVHLTVYSYFMRDYGSSLYFWDSVQMLHKLLIAAIPVMCEGTTATQLVTALLLTYLFTYLHTTRVPFHHESPQLAQSVYLHVQLALIMVGIMIKTGMVEVLSEGSLPGFSSAMQVIMMGTMACATMMGLWMSFSTWIMLGSKQLWFMVSEASKGNFEPLRKGFELHHKRPDEKHRHH